MDEEEELENLIWSNYGFLGNPFDIRALSMFPQSKLSVRNAFVERKKTGRKKPGDQLNIFLKSEGGGCIVLEGEIGVGKTSLVNHQRHRLRKGAHSLFTHTGVIEAGKDWTKKDFLTDLLSTLARTFVIGLDDQEIEENKLLMEIIALTGVFFRSKTGKSFGVTVAGTGVQAGGDKEVAGRNGAKNN